MWKFGNLEINGKVVLAPMAGYTSSGYRKFMKRFGVSLCYSEMVSDMGLIYENDMTLKYLDFSDEENPVGLQLFGSNAESIAKAAQIAVKTCNNFQFIDINAGCPVPKVTKTGAGSSLLREPQKLVDIVKTLKSVTDKPISVKIRLGWDDNHINFKEVIELLEQAGVDLIAIHARTKKDLYLGKPRWELLRNLRSQMHVPLVISGNIYTLDDAIIALEITGADAVMIARGGIGNPQLIKQVNIYYKTGERLPNATLEEQKDYCLSLAKYLIEEKGEEIAMRVYRSIAPKFFSGFSNSKPLRNDLAQNMTTYAYLENALKNFQ